MSEATVGDIIARFRWMSESDALDFEKTGRMVLVVEDGVMQVPLPRGKQGDAGPSGPRGSSLRPDLVLDEETDGAALLKLQERSVGWRNAGQDRENYFAINKPTLTGFFYTRGGWVTIRNLFGGQGENVASEYDLPVTLRNVDVEPETPDSGVRLFCQGDTLKAKKIDGSVVDIA